MGALINGLEVTGFAVGGFDCNGIAKGGSIFWEKPSGIPSDYILALDFNGNTNDKSANLNHATLGTQPIFVTGRKGNDLCASFAAKGIATASAVNINTNTVTVSFWMKTAMTVASIPYEYSPDYNTTDAFNLRINQAGANSTAFQESGLENGVIVFNSVQTVNEILNNNSWKHIVMVIDRTRGVDSISAYINGVKIATTQPKTKDLNAIFTGKQMFIGARNLSTQPFTGQIQQFRMYSRVLSQTEITALYNE